MTSEPVATMMFLALSFFSPPSARSTVTSLAPETLPKPLTYLT
jgi:hypothetical protein